MFSFKSGNYGVIVLVCLVGMGLIACSTTRKSEKKFGKQEGYPNFSLTSTDVATDGGYGGEPPENDPGNEQCSAVYGRCDLKYKVVGIVERSHENFVVFNGQGKPTVTGELVLKLRCEIISTYEGPDCPSGCLSAGFEPECPTQNFAGPDNLANNDAPVPESVCHYNEFIDALTGEKVCQFEFRLGAMGVPQTKTAECGLSEQEQIKGCTETLINDGLFINGECYNACKELGGEVRDCLNQCDDKYLDKNCFAQNCANLEDINDSFQCQLGCMRTGEWFCADALENNASLVTNLERNLPNPVTQHCGVNHSEGSLD